MTRLAITGGRGRLAPMAARFFRNAGYSVSLFSRAEGEGMTGLQRLLGRETIREFDAVLHCAWSTVPFTAEKDPDSARRHDLPLLQELLSVMEGCPAHFVFLSTAAVYGNTDDEPAAESRTPHPLGEYAKAKWAAEQLIQSSDAEHSILRISNLLGEKPDPAKPQGILTNMIRAADAGTELTLWGDGRATKDYLHCDDFFEALRRVFDHRLCGLFNVASEESASLLELIAMVEELTGRPLPRKHVAHFAWDVSYSRISSRKLRSLSGWRPRLTVRQAVEDCLRHLA